MKKMTTTKALAVALMCATTTAAMAMPTTAQAAEATAQVYDLNGDGEFSIADAVIANELLDEGKFSKVDFLNVCNLAVGNEVNVKFEEFDVEGLEATEENILKIQAITASYCLSYDFNAEEDMVTYLYLNDGVITQMHCSTLATTETLIALPVHDGVLNCIGITSDGRFALDEYRSFDLPHSFMEYEEFDVIPTGTEGYLRQVLYGSGKFERLEVESSCVRLWFNNGITRYDIRFNNFDAVEDVIRTIDGINFGFNSEGTICAEVIG